MLLQASEIEFVNINLELAVEKPYILGSNIVFRLQKLSDMPLDAARRAIYVAPCLIYVTRAHEFDLCRAIKCAGQYLQLVPKMPGRQPDWRILNSQTIAANTVAAANGAYEQSVNQSPC